MRTQNQVDNQTMKKVNSLQGKITEKFIDYCNENNIDLVKWYRWQLHLIWEQRNLHRNLEKEFKNFKETKN